MKWGPAGSVLLVLTLGAGMAAAEAPLAPSASPSAQTPRDAMLAEWRQASLEYTLGHYDAAVQHYERGYRLFEEPALLYNLAQAYRKAGALDQALTEYHAYLLRSPPDAPDRELAHKRIAELEAAIAARQNGTSAPAPVLALSSSPSDDAHAPPLVTLAPADATAAPTSHRRWWLWGLAAVVVAGGVTAVLLTNNRTPDAVQGSAGSATIP